MILQIKDGQKSFRSQDIFNGLDLLINENEKLALIGANGAGKTTLFNIFAQEESLDSGSYFKKTGLRMGFLEQIHIDQESIILKDYFDLVFEDLFAMRERLEALEEKLKSDASEQTLKQYDRIQTEFLRRGGYTYETEINTLLTQFKFKVEDLERPLDTFSGGQITRLAFIRLLLKKPEILFLDEPTNHLDISTIEWLEGYLSKYEGAVIVISHDRLFLDRVCNITVEIENKKAIRYESNYTNHLKLKQQMIDRQNTMWLNQQREIEKLDKVIERFRYKSSKAKMVQSKIKHLDRMEKIEKIDPKKRQFKASFSSRLRGGKDVLTVSELQVGYDKPLFEFSGVFERGRRYAIVGDNGTGKSTFLKTLAERHPALSGEMLLGHQIEMGYFDQQLLDFNMKNTVLEEVWDDFPYLDHTEIRTALGRFLFQGEEVFKEVGVLSGGERVRLALVKLMLKQDNLLILDEPTNHLDILGKEALENALLDYDGTMIFVSHDRYFIDRLSTDIYYIEDGRIEHRDLKMTDIIQEAKEIVSEQKEVKRESYQNLKRMKNRSKKIEEDLLPQLYDDLEMYRELRFEPEYYHDPEKMDTLNTTIDDIHIEIKHLEEEWATILMTLEEQA